MLKALDRVLVRLGVGLLRCYRLSVGGLLPPVCRFEPSCSRYAEEALCCFGLVKGSWWAVCRLLRCHPFHPGGWDPVSDVRNGRGGEPAGVGVRSCVSRFAWQRRGHRGGK